MTIRYITSGNEFRAKGLLGEGRHQLSILKNAMSFQNLKQLQRTVRFNDGTIIRCSSLYGHDTVNVFVPPIPIPVIEEKRIIEKVEYEFSFRITRDDGTVVDETTLDNIIITGENGSAGFYRTGMPDNIGVVGRAWGYDEESNDAQYWTLTDGIWNYWNTDDPGYEFGFSYNTDTQIWTVPFYEWLINKEDYSIGDVNPELDTFWCLFNCDDSLWNQMSINDAGYIYKNNDWWDETNLFNAGFYEVRVPVWRTTYEIERPEYVEMVPYVVDCASRLSDIEGKDHYWYYTGSRRGYATTQDNFYKKVTVESSVEYTITEQIRGDDDSFFCCLGYDMEGDYTSGELTCYDIPPYGELCHTACTGIKPYCGSIDAIATISGEHINKVITTEDKVESESISNNYDGIISGRQHIITLSLAEGNFTPVTLTCDVQPAYVLFHHYEKIIESLTFARFVSVPEFSTYINVSASVIYE